MSTTTSHSNHSNLDQSIKFPSKKSYHLPLSSPNLNSNSNSINPTSVQTFNNFTQKKKNSLLSKLSFSSKKSMAILHSRSSSNPINPSHSSTQKSTLFNLVSKNSSINQNQIITQNQNHPQTLQNQIHQSNQNPHRNHSNSFGKSVKSVARSLRKSFHHSDRPTLSQSIQDSQIKSQSFQTIKPQSSSLDHHSSTSITSFENQSFPPKSLPPSLPILPKPSNQSTTLSPKKQRPKSAIETSSKSHVFQSNPTSWKPEIQLASLPMAASLLSVPSPQSKNNSSFLALIPGQTTLSVVPPLASTLLEKSLLTATSIVVEPSSSSRASPTSSLHQPDHAPKEEFTFIRSPPPNTKSLTKTELLPSHDSQLSSSDVKLQEMTFKNSVDSQTSIDLTIARNPSRKRKIVTTVKEQNDEDPGIDRQTKIAKHIDEGVFSEVCLGNNLNQRNLVMMNSLLKDPKEKIKRDFKLEKKPLNGTFKKVFDDKKKKITFGQGENGWNLAIFSTVVGVVVMAVVIIGTNGFSAANASHKSLLGNWIKKAM
ncbi:hypothetical protein O181_082414 [Austropuccinia psidii MF-1]|uniref:Uncharacterized protein n=1 Tax=Austropuccinia psidii MF-1 TaxID=1389203 RepID=A0A9Q3FP80_9BASI|nr:hypothetical protein [Austropuccinia psidii MF-1]